MANRIAGEVNYMLSKRINLLQLTIDCSAFFLFFLLINMQLLLLLWLIQKYEQVMRRWKGDMSEPRTYNYVLPEVLPFPIVSHSSRKSFVFACRSFSDTNLHLFLSPIS